MCIVFDSISRWQLNWLDIMETPKNTGRFGKGNPGKPKGAVNKMAQTAKDAIAQAALALGGSDRLTAWAQEDPSNERVFWGTIYPKLLPLQVTGEGGGPLELSLKLKFVKPNAD